MGYIVRSRDGIKAMSLGLVRGTGERIGDGELPPKLREQMLAEGVIEEVVEVPVVMEKRKKAKRRKKEEHGSPGLADGEVSDDPT